MSSQMSQRLLKTGVVVSCHRSLNKDTEESRGDDLENKLGDPIESAPLPLFVLLATNGTLVFENIC